MKLLFVDAKIHISIGTVNQFSQVVLTASGAFYPAKCAIHQK